VNLVELTQIRNVETFRSNHHFQHQVTETGAGHFTRYRIFRGVWTEAEETIDDLNISFFARQVRELDISLFTR